MKRRLAAILAGDVAEFSRLTAEDEQATLDELRAHREQCIDPTIRRHDGRVVKWMGDGLLVEFASALNAVECAVDIQKQMKLRNATVPATRQQRFRIGINVGDVIAEGGDIYGDGVNIASRLQGVAEPGGICVRRGVRNQVRDRVDYAFEDLGAIAVKNIPRPIRAFRVRLDQSSASRPAWRMKLGVQPRLLIVLLAILLSAGASLWWLDLRDSRRPGPAAPSPVPTLAVLPFANRNTDPAEAYFAEGLTDDLVNDLAKISGLAVIARSSTGTYAGEGFRKIADDLGVDFILEGNVRRTGETVRVNAQLVDATNGRTVWAERYERRQKDLFGLQDRVISKIADALAVRLTESERSRLQRIPTTNSEAYDAYLRAEASSIHTTDPEVLRRTLEHYGRAIELDPDFAEAHAGYAQANAEIWRLGYATVVPGSLARQRALEAAAQALALDPENSRAYSALALMQVSERRHDEAVVSARTATTLAPSDPLAHAYLAVVLAYAGEQQQSLEAVETAMRLSPRQGESLRVAAGIAYFTAGRFELALKALDQPGSSADRSEPARLFLTAAAARADQTDHAARAADDLLRSFPQANTRYFGIAYDFYRSEDDLTRLLDALRVAGIPEWPLGFEPDPGRQVVGRELNDLTIGRTWKGQHAGGSQFMQHIDDKGNFAYRSAASFLTGTGSLRGNEVCIESDGYLLGREYCGAVYRQAYQAFPYTFVSPDALRYFGVTD